MGEFIWHSSTSCSANSYLAFSPACVRAYGCVLTVWPTSGCLSCHAIISLSGFSTQKGTPEGSSSGASFSVFVYFRPPHPNERRLPLPAAAAAAAAAATIPPTSPTTFLLVERELLWLICCSALFPPPAAATTATVLHTSAVMSFPIMVPIKLVLISCGRSNSFVCVLSLPLSFALST